MKANKIIFSKIKTQWEILKMKSAYIEAERSIIQDPSLTGFQDQAGIQPIKGFSPQEFWATFEEDHKPVDLRDQESTERALLRAQIYEVEETGRKLLAEEKYELLQEAKEIWEKLNQKLNNLK